MNVLPKWMRWTLVLTAIYNVFGVFLFVPLLSIGRRLIGLPDAHPFYLWLVTIWIGILRSCMFGWRQPNGRIVRF